LSLFFVSAAHRVLQKRSRDEGKADEPATTPVGAKKAKEEDVKPNVKPVVAGGDKDKAKKARKPKEPRELRHFPLSPIAHPLASAEQQAALFSLLEKAAKAKNLRRGVKEIQKVRIANLVCFHFLTHISGASQEGGRTDGAGGGRGAARRHQPLAGAV
jgi:hypothetical protein